jgi:hypothetical protein
VVSFSQRYLAKPKNNQLAAITLLKDKVDINKKITKKMIKAVRLQYIITFSDNNLNLQISLVC